MAYEKLIDHRDVSQPEPPAAGSRPRTIPRASAVSRSRRTRSAENVDASLLGRVLGRPVAGVRRLDGSVGTTDRARFALRGEGLPPSVFVEMAAHAPFVRFYGTLAGIGRCEVGFHRDLRPGLAIEAPAALGLDQDDATGRFLLVLEDLEARGCRFADVLTPFDRDRSASVLETLAGLHGRHWGLPEAPAWLWANGADPLVPLVARALDPIARRLAGTEPALVPPAGRALLRRYPEVARRLAFSATAGNSRPATARVRATSSATSSAPAW
jgi:hypothetical protein